MKDNTTVTVIGGLTVDLVYRVDKWPQVNQAVQAKSYNFYPGGKGLNQATALARMGLDVQLLGSVGDDNFAEMIFETLRVEGIDNRNIIRQKKTMTDVIGIIVGEDGTPGFIGIRKATSKFTVVEIEKRKAIIGKSSFLLVNSEINSSAVVKALKIAKSLGVTTIFNPAPPVGLPKGSLKYVDYFIPNEWEARALLESRKDLTIVEMLKIYREMGAKNVIITQGKNGGGYTTSDSHDNYRAFKVKEVDQSGAGDAFVGALIWSLIKGQNLEMALNFGSAAGAIACLKEGARSSQPTSKQVKDFLRINK